MFIEITFNGEKELLHVDSITHVEAHPDGTARIWQGEDTSYHVDESYDQIKAMLPKSGGMNLLFMQLTEQNAPAHEPNPVVVNVHHIVRMRPSKMDVGGTYIQTIPAIKYDDGFRVTESYHEVLQLLKKGLHNYGR